MDSLQMVKTIANALDSKKGQDIKAIKVSDLTIVTDYFVIATGTSTTQVRALAQEVEFKMSEQGVEPFRKEGYDTKNWILLDYGFVIVHVFYPENREYYDLEHLWADGEQIEIEFDNKD